MTGMTISRLAKKADVSIDTIRFYEGRGLIASPLERIRTIACTPKTTRHGCASSGGPRNWDSHSLRSRT